MIYELRQYRIACGRMEDTHVRMKRLPQLLARNGLNVTGRWTLLAGPKAPQFVYMLEWKDLAEREKGWAAFYADPEWNTIRVETNGLYEMIEGQETSFLRLNSAFQPKSVVPRREIGGIHQLISQSFILGQNKAVNEFLSEVYIPQLGVAGAEVLGVWDMLSGSNMPRVVLLTAWKDIQNWHSGWASFQSNPLLTNAFRSQRQKDRASLFGEADSYLLEPTPYALPFAL